MKEAILWSVGMLALFHGILSLMCFVTWENGYRILGKGFIIRISLVALVAPLIAFGVKS